jgi:hypothetical protein
MHSDVQQALGPLSISYILCSKEQSWPADMDMSLFQNHLSSVRWNYEFVQEDQIVAAEIREMFRVGVIPA